MSRSLISDAAPRSDHPPFRVQPEVANYSGEGAVRCCVPIVALRSSTHRRLWWDRQKWYTWTLAAVAASQQSLLAVRLPSSRLLMTLILSLKNRGTLFTDRCLQCFRGLLNSCSTGENDNVAFAAFSVIFEMDFFFLLNVLLCYKQPWLIWICCSDSFLRSRRHHVCLWPLKVPTAQFVVPPGVKGDLLMAANFGNSDTVGSTTEKCTVMVGDAHSEH